ncbi:MAG: CDP-alcohol phosphatidyltransferase family protein [Clostridia bacterium]|nr:CDP-alcohol phosphatidyltransferase family protein [Clostridia bacterium]
MANKFIDNPFVKQIPNILTASRVLIAIIILFIKPFSIAFYVIYAWCGISDLFDGVIARAIKVESSLGSLLDTIGDVLLTLTGSFVTFKYMYQVDNLTIWGPLAAVLSIFVFRAIGAIVTLARFKKFAMLHTIGNKVGMILLFLIPLFYELVGTVGAPIFIYAVSGVCILSAIEEIVIELIAKEFNENVKSIFQLIGKKAK